MGTKQREIDQLNSDIELLCTQRDKAEATVKTVERERDDLRRQLSRVREVYDEVHRVLYPNLWKQFPPSTPLTPGITGISPALPSTTQIMWNT